MIANANIYGQLVISSFIAGISLCVLHDVLVVIKAIIFHLPPTKNKTTPKTQQISPKSRIPLDPGCPVYSYCKTLHTVNTSRPDQIITAVTDIIFSLMASCIVIILLFAVNDGIMRGFVLPICAIGAASYHYTLSRPLRKAVTAIALFVLKPILQLLRIIAILLRPPIKRLRSLLKPRKARVRTKARKRSPIDKSSKQVYNIE